MKKQINWPAQCKISVFQSVWWVKLSLNLEDYKISQQYNLKFSWSIPKIMLLTINNTVVNIWKNVIKPLKYPQNIYRSDIFKILL
jgi:hypothetical protein